MASFHGGKPHDGDDPDANRLHGQAADGSGLPHSVSVWKSWGHQDGSQPTPLQLKDLAKVVTTEPSEILRQLTNMSGLRRLLSGNPNKWDVHELVLVALGGFCERNGVESFRNDFIDMVRILEEHKVFLNVANVITHVSTAQVSPHFPMEERMKLLIKGICHLGIEILVLMPAFASNCLGQKFFSDVYALKDEPSIRALNQSSAFELLHEASSRLQNAWEQPTSEEQKSTKRQQEEELANFPRPPDDFRQLSIVPDIKDLCSDEKPFLRRNLVVGKYPDVNTYLDVQFRLVREDFFGPLRQGLKDYKAAIKGRDPSSSPPRVDNMWFYQNAKIIDQEASRVDGITYTLQFSLQGLKSTNWGQSQRLMLGSLILLSADQFKTFLPFTVVGRNKEDLLKGRVTVRSSLEGSSVLPDYVKHPMVMAESSVFFERYRGVLVALQRLSPIHFPMKDYILGQRVTHDIPGYLTGQPVYDLSSVPVVLSKQLVLQISKPQRSKGPQRSCVTTSVFDLVKGEALQEDTAVELKSVPILDENRRPSADALNLDPSQAAALFAALTQKLTVIQGPPGTGKTFLGLKIVKTFLDNRYYWSGPSGSSPAPILVICNTNHALDQFLQGVRKYTNKIVRIGEQSKCDAMTPFTLQKWKEEADKKGIVQSSANWLNQAKNEYSNLTKTKALLNRRQDLQAAERSDVIHEDTLLRMGVISKDIHSKLTSMGIHFQGYSPNASVLPLWLGAGSAELSKDLPLNVPGITQPAPATNKAAVGPAVEDDTEDESLKLANWSDPMQIPHSQRWAICASWKRRAVGLLEEEVGMMESECRALPNRVKAIKTLGLAEVIRGADVVGIVATEAAGQRALLAALQSKIVVVEEAAEVLEAHITAALPSSCQHLILIGDHQQLRPPTTAHELAQLYQFDISLMERLIMKGVRPSVLGLQHRMRPEVARLIVPSIYPQLENHESVTRHPNVPGMRQNVVFLTHTEPEKVDQSDPESLSLFNPYEAELALALAVHLRRQGLDPQKITILTTCAGQLLHMKNLCRNQATLQGVRMAVVDNFKGEENDVIILSLVRSNQEAEMGFLDTPNRISGALSRAKMGFFMIGNMENLERNKLRPVWSQIKQTLEANDQFGRHWEDFSFNSEQEEGTEGKQEGRKRKRTEEGEQ